MCVSRPGCPRDTSPISVNRALFQHARPSNLETQLVNSSLSSLLTQRRDRFLPRKGTNRREDLNSNSARVGLSPIEIFATSGQCVHQLTVHVRSETIVYPRTLEDEVSRPFASRSDVT